MKFLGSILKNSRGSMILLVSPYNIRSRSIARPPQWGADEVEKEGCEKW